jgi:hypothetical protein
LQVGFILEFKINEWTKDKNGQKDVDFFMTWEEEGERRGEMNEREERRVRGKGKVRKKRR